MQSTLKKSFSIAKAQALARQATIATESAKNVAVAAGERCTSPSSRVLFQAVSFKDDTAHFRVAAAARLPHKCQSRLPKVTARASDTYCRIRPPYCDRLHKHIVTKLVLKLPEEQNRLPPALASVPAALLSSHLTMMN